MKIFSWISQKLARRFGIPAVVMAGFAVLMLSLFVYDQVRDLSKEAASSQLMVAVDLQERELKRWIEDQKTTVVFISRAALVRERIADLLTREKNHAYYQAAFRDLSEYLFSYIKNFSGLREIMILSERGGQVLFSTTEESINEFRSRDTFFLKGKDQLFVQGVYPWRETGEPTLTISRPLLDALGVKKGVLAVHLDLERMDRVVNDHPGLGQTGEIYLVDKFNTFINNERFGRTNFPRGVHTEGIDRAVAGEEGFRFYENYAGIPVVGYYRWLPEFDVAIIAEIHQTEVFSAARQMGITIGIFGVMLTLLLGLGTLILARKIATPLVEMSQMAQCVAAGDFSVTVPQLGNDETSALAEALNQMVANLRQVYDEVGNTAEYFKTIFNLNPSSISVQRFDNGNFVQLNEGFCQMFALSTVDALGRNAEELNIWHSNISRLRLVALLKKEEAVADYEAKFVRSGGEVFNGIISARTVDLGGEKHIVSILVDLSDIRKTEQDLRDTTERLQLLVQRMPIGCITWNPDFQVELWNPAAEEIFGFSAAEAIGRSAYDLIVPAEVKPVVEPIWQQLLAGSETAHSENENITKDSRMIVCDWYNTPLKDEEGRAMGVVSMVRDITEKKAAENNLRHQKELLQTILDAIPAPIFFKDVNGVYQGCNEAFCDYLGFSYDQIVGHSIFDINSADKAQAHLEFDQELLEKGGIQIYEAKVRFASVFDRNVVFHKAVYRNPDGSIAGLVGNMIDVTEIRKAEKELAESELNYREVFNASSEAIFIRDMETKELLDVNQAMLDMYGYDYDEALVASFKDLVSGEHPYTSDQAYEKMELARNGKPQLFEWQARKKDGTLFWTEIALKQATIRGESRLLSVVRDISDRKQAEQAQRESDERFQLLLEHAADALFLHDDEGVILTVNQRSCDTLGYKRDDLLGMKINELERGVPTDRLKNFWASLEPGKSSLIQGTHFRKDGSSFPVDVNVVKFGFQGAWFYLALARDVSERKATEKELELYRNQLESLVRERTEQLESAQEELVQKEKMAVLGQLTATVSHELRNPLGTVKNAIHLLGRLKDVDEPEKFTKALDMAGRNVNRCDGIINELLDYTRKQEWTPVEIDISDWLESVLEDQQIPDDIKITRSRKKGLKIACDPERLRRAVINVYTNAIQALQKMDSRKPVLKIKLEEVEHRLLISFSDNAAGMDEQSLERIFEPMYSTKNFGVGLGMPIVKNIMEEHAGGVEIVSKPGKGTTVTLWLPRK